MDIQKIISHIKDFIHAKGFVCENGIIENMYLCLKSTPFLMLSGPGSREKYHLVKMLCESLDITSKNNRFKVVAPGGFGDKIFNPAGYICKDGTFCPGEILKFMISALQNPDCPYVLYIDNLNAVNPDEYMRDILKTMDTAVTDENGRLVSEPVFNKDVFETDHEKEMFGNITYPQNLYIICSICGDRDFFSISPRLKERANVIEFKPDTLIYSNEKPEKCIPCENVKTDFLKPERDLYFICDESDENKLKEIHRILTYTNAECSFFLKREILIYLALNRRLNLLPPDDAFDNCLVQRILTRIDEADPDSKNILSLLFRQCVTKGVGDYYSGSLKMHRALDYPDCIYKKAARKIAHMTRRIEENGYCTF